MDFLCNFTDLHIDFVTQKRIYSGIRNLDYFVFEKLEQGVVHRHIPQIIS